MTIVPLDQLQVLIIDDNDHMRAILRQMLHAFGVRQMLEASDGRAALAVLQQNHIDLVITDWLMEPVSGLSLVSSVRGEATATPKKQPSESATKQTVDLLAQARKVGVNPFVPIIMVSGCTEHREILIARDAGIDEFLAKPVSARGLFCRVVSVTHNPRPFIRTSNYFGPDRRRHAVRIPFRDRRVAGCQIVGRPEPGFDADFLERLENEATPFVAPPSPRKSAAPDDDPSTVEPSISFYWERKPAKAPPPR